MMYFMCTNQLRKSANPLHLITLAHMYQMDRLFWKCAQRICKEVTVGTFVETVKILNKYDIEAGFELVVAFGKRNVTELQKRDDFNKLSCAFRKVVLGASKKSQ